MSFAFSVFKVTSFYTHTHTHIYIHLIYLQVAKAYSKKKEGGKGICTCNVGLKNCISCLNNVPALLPAALPSGPKRRKWLWGAHSRRWRWHPNSLKQQKSMFKIQTKLFTCITGATWCNKSLVNFFYGIYTVFYFLLRINLERRVYVTHDIIALMT